MFCLWLQDYKELSCSLSELPVNEYTASELVRLCLRPQDIHDARDGDNSTIEEEVVGIHFILELFIALCVSFCLKFLCDVPSIAAANPSSLQKYDNSYSHQL